MILDNDTRVDFAFSRIHEALRDLKEQWTPAALERLESVVRDTQQTMKIILAEGE